jgi:2-dehydropantoate 2-reductase
MKIGIMGAGAVGCFVGAKLVIGGAAVTFVGRARGQADADAYGMVLEDLDGPSGKLAPGAIDYAVDVGALAPCDVVLCAVKSAQTREAAASMAGVLRDGTLVVSLQNGLRNADALRDELPQQVVLGGIVGFNVVARDGGVYRRATTGPLAIEQREDARLTELAGRLTQAGFDVERPKNIRAKQWSKLVLNLNNALSALSGAPTQRLIFDPAYRRIVRAVAAESLGVMRAAKVETARLGPLPVAAFPFILSLPTPLLKVVLRAQLTIDPEARSSMWQDLSKGRTTEVDELNGEIVRLAKSCGAKAPLNERLVALVQVAEHAAKGSPNLSAAELWQGLTGAR